MFDDAQIQSRFLYDFFLLVPFLSFSHPFLFPFIRPVWMVLSVKNIPFFHLRSPFDLS